MNYFAKLVVGGVYIVGGVRFERGVELPVSEGQANYVKTLTDSRIVVQGDKRALINVPLFQVREEELTVQEKVLDEIKDAPDSLKPKRRKEPE
jgi:hypothetical protein